MNLTKKQRDELRTKFGGMCAYCGCALPEKGWHADHVEPVLREWWKSTKWWAESKGWKHEIVDGKIVQVAVPVDKTVSFERPQNDTLDNLFPSCRACNIDKHCSSLESWRKQMEDRVGVCRRNYSAFRHAERFGLVQEIKKPVVFWFEQYRLIGDSINGIQAATASSKCGTCGLDVIFCCCGAAASKMVEIK